MVDTSMFKWICGRKACPSIRQPSVLVSISKSECKSCRLRFKNIHRGKSDSVQYTHQTRRSRVIFTVLHDGYVADLLVWYLVVAGQEVSLRLVSFEQWKKRVYQSM